MPFEGDQEQVFEEEQQQLDEQGSKIIQQGRSYIKHEAYMMCSMNQVNHIK